MSWITNREVYKEILKSIKSRKDKKKYKKLIKQYRQNSKKERDFEEKSKLYCQYQIQNYNDLRRIEYKYNLDFYKIREEIANKRKEVEKDEI